jgi:hypothetical protein
MVGFGRDIDEPLTRHLGAVRDASEDIRFFETGVSFENLTRSVTVREQVQDQRHPNAMAPNARLAKAYFRINRAGSGLQNG